MEARAIAKYVRISPRKCRIVIDKIRGKDVIEALDILRFNERAASETIAKVLSSAVANARQAYGLRPESLTVKACYVDEGPTLKRYRPRAKGAASSIHKRTSHITVVVAPRKEA